MEGKGDQEASESIGKHQRAEIRHIGPRDVRPLDEPNGLYVSWFDALLQGLARRKAIYAAAHSRYYSAHSPVLLEYDE
jgi:hypothetical protein